jgi:uncharacterized membrane-anchored protein YitT (DUF2179 family)
MALDKAVARFRRTTSDLHPAFHEVIRVIAILAAAVIVAIGLEFFLVPNGFIDGGITGISIMVADAVSVPLGVVLAILNFPFIIVAWKASGFSAAYRTALGIAALSVAAIVLHHQPAWTDEPLIAMVFGGALIGSGVGLALRFGGALDGLEALAHIVSKRTNIDVEKFILSVNVLIFLAAAFVYSWEAAMYSFIMFYFFASTMIKRVMEGGYESKSAQIVSQNHLAVGEAIHKAIGRKVIYLDAHNDDMVNDVKIVMAYFTRMEEAEMTEAVEKADPNAVIVISDVANVRGGSLSRKH